jgi:hypothetical protein
MEEQTGMEENYIKDYSHLDNKDNRKKSNIAKFYISYKSNKTIL